MHDPEMRHGRKSAKRRFDGHKAQVAVDPESQLITAADVLAGNVQDHERALELVEQVEANADAMVEESVGDCAYGDSDTRQAFTNAGRKLVAKVASRRGQAQFPKEDFQIDLETMSCVCPAGQRTQKVVSISSGERYGALGVPLRAFRFDAAICEGCPLRASCMRARLGKGRVVMIHPQEALLQEARAFQQSEAFASISQTAAGSRTQAGATYAARRAAGPLHRSNQDALPTPPSRHRREPNAGGDRGRPHARSQPHQGASVSPAWWLIDDDTERDLARICSWDPPYITAEG